MLTRDQILEADDRRYMDVDVEEWGGKIRVQTMSSRERQEFQKKIQATEKGVPSDLMEQIIIACAVGEDGEKIFNQDDMDALSSKSSLAMTVVFNAAAELNGMTKGSIDQIKGE